MSTSSKGTRYLAVYRSFSVSSTTSDSNTETRSVVYLVLCSFVATYD